MSTSHHGDPMDPRDPGPDLAKLMQRFNDQVSKTAKREYPHGRLGGDDEGALAFAVKADHENGTVVINFGKPVVWIGLTPKDIAGLVKLLVEKAREVAKEPFTVTL